MNLKPISLFVTNGMNVCVAELTNTSRCADGLVRLVPVTHETIGQEFDMVLLSGVCNKERVKYITCVYVKMQKKIPVMHISDFQQQFLCEREARV